MAPAVDMCMWCAVHLLCRAVGARSAGLASGSTRRKVTHTPAFYIAWARRRVLPGVIVSTHKRETRGVKPRAQAMVTRRRLVACAQMMIGRSRPIVHVRTMPEGSRPIAQAQTMAEGGWPIARASTYAVIMAKRQKARACRTTSACRATSASRRVLPSQSRRVR